MIKLFFIFLILVLFLNSPLTENFSQNNIAFLFLIYDKINNIDLWNNFFKNAYNYNIYIHYKKNIKLKYFDKYKIKNIIDTKWGDISIVQAQINLLKEALKNKSNKKFIFVSQSCIPVKNYQYIYKTLMNNNKSYFKNYHIPEYAKDCFKTSQWCILDRKMAEFFVNQNDLDNFKNIHAPDEIYFITKIIKNNLTRQCIFKENNELTTFDNWNNNVYPNSKGKGMPFNYSQIDLNELKSLINSKNLFARKFDDKCINLDYLNNAFSMFS